jgi:hypothetical protein
MTVKNRDGLTVDQGVNGWDVLDLDGTVLVSFPTNAQAWRWVDRQTGDAISRSEKVSEWIMSKD